MCTRRGRANTRAMIGCPALSAAVLLGLSHMIRLVGSQFTFCNGIDDSVCQVEGIDDIRRCGRNNCPDDPSSRNCCTPCTQEISFVAPLSTGLPMEESSDCLPSSPELSAYECIELCYHSPDCVAFSLTYLSNSSRLISSCCFYADTPTIAGAEESGNSCTYVKQKAPIGPIMECDSKLVEGTGSWQDFPMEKRPNRNGDILRVFTLNSTTRVSIDTCYQLYELDNYPFTAGEVLLTLYRVDPETRDLKRMREHAPRTVCEGPVLARPLPRIDATLPAGEYLIAAEMAGVGQGGHIFISFECTDLSSYQAPADNEVAEQGIGSWRNVCPQPLSSESSSGAAVCDEAAMPPARYHHAATSFEGNLYIYGGIHTTVLNAPEDFTNVTRAEGTCAWKCNFKYEGGKKTCVEQHEINTNDCGPATSSNSFCHEMIAEQFRACNANKRGDFDECVTSCPQKFDQRQSCESRCNETYVSTLQWCGSPLVSEDDMDSCTQDADVALSRCNETCVQVLDDLWVLAPDPASSEPTWRELCADCDPRPQPRYSAMTAVIAEGEHHLLFLFGGSSTTDYTWPIRLLGQSTLSTPALSDLWMIRLFSNGTVAEPWQIMCSFECFIASPSPRFGGALVPHGRSLWLFGGQDDQQPLSDRRMDVHAFDTDVGAWKRVCGNGALVDCCAADGCPDARSDFAYALTQSGPASESPRVYVVGGIATQPDSIATIKADAWYFDLSREQWVAVDALPENAPRYASSLVPMDDGRLFLYGGSDAPQLDVALNDLWALNITTGNWSLICGCTGEECVSCGTAPGGRVGQTVSHVPWTRDNSSSSSSSESGGDVNFAGSLLMYGGVVAIDGKQYAAIDVLHEFISGTYAVSVPDTASADDVADGFNSDAESLFTHFFDGLAGLNRAVLPVIGAFVGAMVILSLASYFYRKPEDASPLCLLLVALALADTATDIMFQTQLLLTQTEYSERLLANVFNEHFALLTQTAAGFVITPLAVNGAYAIGILASEFNRSEEFKSWLWRYWLLAGIMVLVSCLGLDSLRLLSSRLFALKMLDAPFSSHVTQRLQWLGIIGLLLENIPQLILQSVVAARGSAFVGFGVSLLPSLLLSCVSIVVRLCAIVRFTICGTVAGLANAKAKAGVPSAAGARANSSDDSDNPKSLAVRLDELPLTNPELDSDSDSVIDSDNESDGPSDDSDDVPKKPVVEKEDSGEREDKPTKSKHTSQGVFDANSRESRAKPKHRKEIKRRPHSRGDSHKADGNAFIEILPSSDSEEDPDHSEGEKSRSESDSDRESERESERDSDHESERESERESDSDVSDHFEDDVHARAAASDASKAKFACKECGKRFTMKCNMMTHFRNTHQNRAKKHNCEVCGRTFGRRYNLRQHMLTHNAAPNAKTLECHICAKGFSQKANYLRHVTEVHEMPGKCSARGCNARVRSESEFRRHCARAHPDVDLDSASPPVKMALRGKRAMQCYCKTIFKSLDEKLAHSEQCVAHQRVTRDVERLRNASGVPDDLRIAIRSHGSRTANASQSKEAAEGAAPVKREIIDLSNSVMSTLVKRKPPVSNPPNLTAPASSANALFSLPGVFNATHNSRHVDSSSVEHHASMSRSRSPEEFAAMDLAPLSTMTRPVDHAHRMPPVDHAHRMPPVDHQHRVPFVSSDADLGFSSKVDPSLRAQNSDLRSVSISDQQVLSSQNKTDLSGTRVALHSSLSPRLEVTPAESDLDFSQPGAGEAHDNGTISLAKLEVLQKLERMIPANDEQGLSEAFDELVRAYHLMKKQAPQNSLNPSQETAGTLIRERTHRVSSDREDFDAVPSLRSSSERSSSSRRNDRSRSPLLFTQNSQLSSTSRSPQRSVSNSPRVEQRSFSGIPSLKQEQGPELREQKVHDSILDALIPVQSIPRASHIEFPHLGHDSSQLGSTEGIDRASGRRDDAVSFSSAVSTATHIPRFGPDGKASAEGIDQAHLLTPSLHHGTEGASPLQRSERDIGTALFDSPIPSFANSPSPVSANSHVRTQVETPTKLDGHKNSMGGSQVPLPVTIAQTPVHEEAKSTSPESLAFDASRATDANEGIASDEPVALTIDAGISHGTDADILSAPVIDSAPSLISLRGTHSALRSNSDSFTNHFDALAGAGDGIGSLSHVSPEGSPRHRSWNVRQQHRLSFSNASHSRRSRSPSRSESQKDADLFLQDAGLSMEMGNVKSPFVDNVLEDFSG